MKQDAIDKTTIGTEAERAENGNKCQQGEEKTGEQEETSPVASEQIDPVGKGKSLAINPDQHPAHWSGLSRSNPGKQDEPVLGSPGSGRKNAGEQTQVSSQPPKRKRTPKLSPNYPAHLQPVPLTSEQAEKSAVKQTKDFKDLLTSEQGANDDSEQAVSNLKTLLPQSVGGWWEVRAEGRGFVIKFRWRNPEQQTQTFPRVSRERYDILKGVSNAEARLLIRDSIAGHLDDLTCNRDRRAKAILVAERLSIRLEDGSNAATAS